MLRVSWRFLPIAVSAGLIALRAWSTWHLAAPAPILDEWDINGSLLGRLDSDRSILSTLFARHNVHRLVTMRLLLLAMLPLAHWNVLVLLAVNFLTAGSVAALLWLVYRRSCREAGIAPDRWVVLALCALAFSPAQLDIWLIGDNWTFPGCNLFAIAGLAWVSLGGNTRSAFLGGAACGVLATLSNFHGLFLWPVAAGVAALQGNGIRRWAWAGAWMALGLVMWRFYFARYDPNIGASYMFSGLSEVGGMALFLLAYLGNPVGAIVPPKSLAAMVVVPALGAAYLAGLGLGLAWLWRARPPLRPYLPWLAITAFFLVTALSVASGRSRDGFEVALSSRYVSMSYALWIALLAMGYLVASRAVAGAGPATGLRTPRGLYPAMLIALIGIPLLSLPTLEQRGRETATERQRATEELPDVCDGNFDQLRLIYQDPGRIADYLPVFAAHDIAFLRQARVSEFRIGAEPSSGIALRAQIEPFRPRSPACLRIDGEVRNAELDGIVAIGGDLVLKRKRFRRPERETGAWTMWVSLGRIPAESPVTLYAYARDEHALRPIAGAAPIEVHRLPPPGPRQTIRQRCGPDGACEDYR